MNMTIIFGSHSYNTLGTIRCMAEKGMPFRLLLVRGSRLCNVTLHSRYVKHFHVVGSEEEGVQWLVAHKDAWKGSVVYPTSDKAESVLDSQYDTLVSYYRFPNAGKQGEVNRLMDKEVQTRMAAAAGLCTLNIFKNVNMGRVKYPCLLKAKKSIRGGKQEMRLCRSAEELRTALASSRFASELLIQEYIDKEYDLLLLGCRLPDGEILLPSVFKKERWFMQDGSFGLVSTRTAAYFGQDAEIRRFVESLHYTGPFSIEFGVKDGKAYFYEINLRNDGTSHYFHRAGIFVPYWFCLSYTGCLAPEDLAHGDGEYLFIDEFGDIANVFLSRLPLLQWLKDLRRAHVYKYYDPRDKVPFLHLLPKQILSVSYKIVKEIQSRCRRRTRSA